MQEGREDDFEDAFDGLFLAAFRLARRMLGDDAAAEDVAAEALARTYAHWSSVRHLPWRHGWVLRVASNLALDAARSGRRRTDPPPLTADDESDHVAVRLALVSALRSLPRRQRQAVTLRYLGGLSEAEVALALRVSPGAVKSHLHRGMASLRRRLGPTFGNDRVLEASLAAD